MKRIIALILVFLVAFTGLSIVCTASADKKSGGFTYTVLEDGTACITVCGLTGDIVIPSEIDGYTVTHLADDLFNGRSDITSVYIPATVTSLAWDPDLSESNMVFPYCVNLKSITVDPDNPNFCSVDGVLYNKKKTYLIDYPPSKEGRVFHVPDSVLYISCAAFASNVYLRKLYLSDPDTWWNIYTFYESGKLTVYYPPGGYAEKSVKQEKEDGRSKESNEIYPVYWNVTEQEPEPRGWMETEDYSVMYIRDDGTKAIGWLTIDGKNYYMDEQGLMVTGFRTINGKHYLFDENGVMATETRYTDDAGLEYYLGADGAAVTGLAVVKIQNWITNRETGESEIQITEKKRFFNENGVMQTGWQTAGGKLYYFDIWGDMVTNSWRNKTQEDGTTDFYYLGEDGAAQTGFVTVVETSTYIDPETGEQQYSEKKVVYYCDPDGRMATGWRTAEDGKLYYFRSDGKMKTNGWESDGEDYYFLGEDGTIQIGFITIRETYTEKNPETGENEEVTREDIYYCDQDGKRVTGWLTIDNNKKYYFDYDGIMMKNNWMSETQEDGTTDYYYLGEDGTMQTGFVTIVKRIPYHDSETGELQYTEENVLFYFDPDGKKATGWRTAENGKTYYFDIFGAKTSSWINDGGVKYYLGEDGTMQTGWINDSGIWYYMQSTGAMATGWVCDNAAWYYMNDQGAMQTGWISVGGACYYMLPTGMMATGWVNDGDSWYYMNADGIMQKGWIFDGDRWYYMKSSGAMAIGWVSDGGAWYYMQPTGTMATGWVSDGGKWYYFDASGKMATGWQYASGAWYYFKKSGAMASYEWIEDKEAEALLPADQKRALWYWFDWNGTMATGWEEIDNQWEMFSDSGEWLYSWQGN